MRVNDTFMRTHISTYTHTHTCTHAQTVHASCRAMGMWQTITIQSQTNHTIELGLSLQEQVGEAGLAEGWDSIHFPKS